MTDEAEVCRLWRQHPAPLIGVATGAVSGIDVLDVDVKHGGIDWLDKHINELPPTRTQETRSGGYHLLFKHQSG